MDNLKPTIDFLVASLSKIDCPDCNAQLSWEIHPRTGIQDRHVLICQNNGCKQFGKRWAAPTLELRPAC